MVAVSPSNNLMEVVSKVEAQRPEVLTPVGPFEGASRVKLYWKIGAAQGRRIHQTILARRIGYDYTGSLCLACGDGFCR